MSDLDRDLYAALAPLAGDPKDIARRVLAALPKEPPPPPPRPRLPLLPLLLAMGAAFGLGFVTGRSLELKKWAATEPAEKKPLPTTEPEMLAVLGECVGYDNRKQVLRFATGDRFSVPVFLETNGRVALRLAQGLEVFADRKSAMNLESTQHLTCKDGRFYVSVHRPQGVMVDVAEDVQAQATHAEFVVVTGGDGVRIVVLDGLVALAQGKSDTKLKRGMEVRIDPKAGLTDARQWTAAELEKLVGWQAELLLELRRR